MNYLSKSFITGTLALLITTAALASSMATSAESRGRVHFRHGFFDGHQCFDNRRRLVRCVVHFTGRHPGYVAGNSLVKLRLANCHLQEMESVPHSPAHLHG